MIIKKSTAIKYCLFSIVLLVSGGAAVLGYRPFGIGLFMSMCFVGLNPLILAPVFIGSSLLYSFTWQTALGSGVVSLVFAALWLIRRHKKFPQYVYYIAALPALAGYVPMMTAEIAPLILFVFFAPTFLFVGQAFFYPVLKRGLKFKLLDHELVCGGVILCVLALGLCRAEFFYFPLVAAIAAFVILFAAKIYGVAGAMIAGLCFGIGSSVFDYQIIWMAYYPLMALLAAVFVPTPRPVSVVALLAGYILVTYFFNLDALHAYMWLAALTAGGIAYILIPKRKLAQIKSVLNPDYSPAAARYNINLLREHTARGILRTGEVFEEMSRYVGGGGTFTPDTALLVERIRGEVCSGCGKKCSVTNSDIATLIETSIEKGRATIVDLPASVIESCKFSAGMISATAALANEYHKMREKKNTEKMAKDIVADQLRGVGDVLKAMSASVSPPLSYDFDKEKKIKEELVYNGIYCHDVILSPSAATLVVAPEHYERRAVERLLKKAAKTSFSVESETEGSTGMIIYAPKSPALDVVFAVAGAAKNEKSGDTHSFIKISGDRFLMALCDGMGSGERAERFSSGTISLIECFYKAGFDHSTVIKSVNRFLSLSGEEAFAASDICVLDLNSGVADIFKIGSPACYIKGAETVRTVEGSSLPIGALDEIRPGFSQSGLSGGDMIVLVSDGVSDCFDGDGLAAEISCASDVSPEALCQQILTAAKKKSPRIRDDMTVAALRVFENI